MVSLNLCKPIHVHSQKAPHCLKSGRMKDLATAKYSLETSFYIKSLKFQNKFGNYELANIWKTYFNVAWFTGLSPFKIVGADDGQLNLLQFKRKQSQIRRVLCVLLFLLTIVFSNNNLIQNVLYQGFEFTYGKSGFFFLLAISIIQLTLPPLTFWEFWFKQGDIIDIINFLGNPATCMPQVSNRCILKVKLFACGSLLVICVGEIIVDQYVLLHNVGSHELWYSLCLTGGEFLFFGKDTCMGTGGVTTLSGKFVAILGLTTKWMW